MIMLALFAAAATAASPPPQPRPQTQPVVSPAIGIAAAERAFARRAQVEGQWKAFRLTAAPDAILFVPDAKPVAKALEGATEPAVPVMWWPGVIAPSCDGTLGLSTGPWVRAASGGQGTFTTIWKRTPSGYRWVLDHGRPTPKLVAAGNAPTVIAPDCTGTAATREAEYDKLAASMAARIAGVGRVTVSLLRSIIFIDIDSSWYQGQSPLTRRREATRGLYFPSPATPALAQNLPRYPPLLARTKRHL